MTDNAIPLEEFIGPRKPCPFCGSTDLEMNCWEEYVVCKKCDASAPVGQWQFRAISAELATAKADLARAREDLTPVAWLTARGTVLRRDMKELFGWSGGWVDMDRATPDSWTPFLFVQSGPVRAALAPEQKGE